MGRGLSPEMELLLTNWPERELKLYLDFSNLASIVGAQKWVPALFLAMAQKAVKENHSLNLFMV
jgi:hypothetical protein